jgi:hypothetical protein
MAELHDWSIRLLLWLLVLYVGLRLLVAGLTPEPFWHYLRYTLIGLWVACGAPWLFLRLKLVQDEMGGSSAHPTQSAFEPVEF